MIGRVKILRGDMKLRLKNPKCEMIPCGPAAEAVLRGCLNGGGGGVLRSRRGIGATWEVIPEAVVQEYPPS